jgi:hypothetical protein
MTDPRTPSTEAGRRLMRSTETQDDGTWSGLDLTAFRDGILAIEAEASTLGSSDAERQRAIGAAVERLPKLWSLHQFRDGYWVVRNSEGLDMTLARATLPEAIDAALSATSEPT